MKLIVLEGPHDANFLQSVLSNLLKINDFYLLCQKCGKYKKSIKKAMSKLLEPKEFKYFKEKYRAIIYVDNGAPTVLGKVLPRFITDLFGKNPPVKIEILTILDADCNGRPQVVKKQKRIIDDLKEKLTTKMLRHTRIDCTERFLTITHSKSPSYMVSCQIHLIPKSLEHQIVANWLAKGNFSRTEKSRIQGVEVHKAIGHISQIRGLEKKDVYQQPVINGWLNREPWFRSVVRTVDSFFSQTP